MGFVANYILNLADLARRRQPRRPLLFSYYITHRCDLNCRYCCDGEGKRFKEDRVPELATPDVKRLLRILRRAADTLDITGGEPLLREDLEEVLAEARQLRLRTVLNTKALGIRERQGMLRYSDTLVLGLDALDAGRLAVLIGRPRERADEILASLRWLIEKRNESGFKLVLSAVATPDNVDDVAGVLRFCVENRLGFHLSPELVGTRAHPALHGNARYRGLLETVRLEKTRTRGILGVDSYLCGIRDFSPFVCHPLLMPVIRPDGRMYYPCLESKQAEASILEAGDYGRALVWARSRYGEMPKCESCCHIFCHAALSLLQRRPFAALKEMRHWRT